MQFVWKWGLSLQQWSLDTKALFRNKGPSFPFETWHFFPTNFFFCNFPIKPAFIEEKLVTKIFPPTFIFYLLDTFVKNQNSPKNIFVQYPNFRSTNSYVGLESMECFSYKNSPTKNFFSNISHNHFIMLFPQTFHANFFLPLSFVQQPK